METIPYDTVSNITPAGLVSTFEASGHSVAQSPEGWLVDDATAFQDLVDSYTGSADELAWNKTNAHGTGLLDQLAVIYQGKYDAGFNYIGSDSVEYIFQIDPVSQGHIDGQATAALGSILNSEPWDANTYFIAADNSMMPVPTAADMRAFALAAHRYISDLIVYNRDLKDQINAAPDMATLSGIDIAAGWPANP